MADPEFTGKVLRWWAEYFPERGSINISAIHALSEIFAPRDELDRVEKERDEARRALLAIAAGAHRAKWTYEDVPRVTGAPSVFDFLHNLGDQANEAARSARRPQNREETDAGNERIS